MNDSKLVKVEEPGWAEIRDSLFAALVIPTVIVGMTGLREFTDLQALLLATMWASCYFMIINLWHQHFGWWEAICRPAEQGDRIYKKEKAEREAAEAKARAEALAEEKREQEQRVRYRALTGRSKSYTPKDD